MSVCYACVVCVIIKHIYVCRSVDFDDDTCNCGGKQRRRFLHSYHVQLDIDSLSNTYVNKQVAECVSWSS